MSDAIATVLAAVIGVIGTIIVTKFDDISNFLRKPSRNISGEWAGSSFLVVDGKISEQTTSEFVVKITQKGEKIEGTMTQTRVSKDNPSVFKWKGKILNDYLMYDSIPAGDTKFFISSGLLYIHPAGDNMNGYIVANARPEESQRTRIRFTELTRRV